MLKNIIKTVCAKCYSDSATSHILLPKAVLPSETLLQSLNRGAKSRLAKLLVEVEYLYGISVEVPRELSDHHWRDLCDIASPRERELFLRTQYFAELSHEKIAQGNAETLKRHYERHEEQCRRYDAGEMIYGSCFYNLYGCFTGVDFRAMIDRLYGCQFWAAHRLEEPPIKLIIDCRNLPVLSTINVGRSLKQIQLLHDRNWSSADPYEIVVANFLADDTAARAIRKHWFFMFGPPSYKRSHPQAIPDDDVDGILASLENAQELTDNDAGATYGADDDKHLSDNVEEESANEKFFRPHPFAPQITNRSIIDVLKESGISKEEAVYLSPWSRAFFDDELRRRQQSATALEIRAIVLPLFDKTTQPWHNSLTAAVGDEIPAFRLPIEKHLIWKTGNKTLALRLTYEILYGVMKRGISWAEALKIVPSYYVSNANLTEDIQSSRQDIGPKNSDSLIAKSVLHETRKRRWRMLEEMANQMNQRHVRIQNTESRNNYELPENHAIREPTKRIHKHRYSREERNKQRLERLSDSN